MMTNQASIPAVAFREGRLSMDTITHLRSAVRWLAFAGSAAVGAYASYVGVTWCRYGHVQRPAGDEPDQLLDRFIPSYVKIAWTLRADPIGERESHFRTETRVVATDPSARARFRRYWAFLSPGIILIRWMSLAPLKAEAERRARRSAHPQREPSTPPAVEIRT